MKLILLVILLCGINSSNYTINRKPTVNHMKTTAANFDILPLGLLFQF